MLAAGNVGFDEMQADKYVTDLQTYWSDNKSVFKLDSVSFLYIWGSLITWIIIASLCLIIGLVPYAKLPPEISVQYSNGSVVSLVNKIFIFAYPLACIIFRLFLRPIIYVRLLRNSLYGELITEYLTNYLCFIALSVESFFVLFIYGLVKNIVIVLLIDTIVLISVVFPELLFPAPNTNSLYPHAKKYYPGRTSFLYSLLIRSSLIIALVHRVHILHIFDDHQCNLKRNRIFKIPQIQIGVLLNLIQTVNQSISMDKELS